MFGLLSSAKAITFHITIICFSYDFNIRKTDYVVLRIVDRDVNKRTILAWVTVKSTTSPWKRRKLRKANGFSYKFQHNQNVQFRCKINLVRTVGLPFHTKNEVFLFLKTEIRPKFTFVHQFLYLCWIAKLSTFNFDINSASGSKIVVTEWNRLTSCTNSQ